MKITKNLNEKLELIRKEIKEIDVKLVISNNSDANSWIETTTSPASFAMANGSYDIELSLNNKDFASNLFSVIFPFRSKIKLSFQFVKYIHLKI